MAKVSEINSTVQLKLKLLTEIAELLKARKVNISELDIKLKTYTKKKPRARLSPIKNVVVEGEILIKISARVNPDMNLEVNAFTEEDDEMLDEDYLDSDE